MPVYKVADALLNGGNLLIEEADMGSNISQDRLGLDARFLTIQFPGTLSLEHLQTASQRLQFLYFKGRRRPEARFLRRTEVRNDLSNLPCRSCCA